VIDGAAYCVYIRFELYKQRLACLWLQSESPCERWHSKVHVRSLYRDGSALPRGCTGKADTARPRLQPKFA
jgi:hypothetical protein